jgi:phosphatidylglycerophosphatase C
MKKKLALFDFDGTITTKDTLLEFLIFYKGPVRFLWGMFLLSPVLMLYFLKLIPNWKGKQMCLRYFLGGEDVGNFTARCHDFSERILPGLIRPQALETINAYKLEGAQVAVVTASAENWVQPWCDQLGLICVGTQLEVENGRITGNLCGANCYGPEKVKRIEKQFRLADFKEVIAYGDSTGDREMFSIAHQHHYKPFRSRQRIEKTKGTLPIANQNEGKGESISTRAMIK